MKKRRVIVRGVIPRQKPFPPGGGNSRKQILAELQNIKKELRKIMATIQERFDNLNANLDEATTEILAELAKLRQGELTPEQEAALTNIEAKVNALKDTSPPVE